MDIKSLKAAEPEVSVNDVSRISSGTVIKGEISSDCDIRVDGKVEGKIFSKGKIVVGTQAFIKGAILCNNCDFWGGLDGDIYVKDVLNVKSSSKISGGVKVNKLQVEMGAQINGTCHMISTAEYDKFVESVVSTKLDAAPAAPAAKK